MRESGEWPGPVGLAGARLSTRYLWCVMDRQALVDLGAISGNVAALCKRVRGSQVMAVIGQHGSTDPGLGGAGRGARVGRELVVEAPARQVVT